MAVKLTEKQVKNLKACASVRRIRDALEPGLCLVISAQPKDKSISAGKTWSFQYTSPTVPDIDRKTGQRRTRTFKDGRTVQLFARPYITIGHYPDVGLARARERAHALRIQVNAGIDPLQAKEAEQEAAREAERKAAVGTVADLFAMYLEDLRLDNKNTKDVKAAYVMDVEQQMGQVKAKDVTQRDILKLLSVIDKRGAHRKVDLVRGYLRRAFELGLETQSSVRWVDKADDFGLVYNPVARIKRVHAPVTGERALTVEEVQRFWREAGVNCMRADKVLAVKLILATGQRVQELYNATWSEFDMQARLWSIPMSRRKLKHKAKNNEPLLVPLTDLTIGLLAELRGFSNGEFLFPDSAGDKPENYRSLSKAVSRFCTPAPQSKRQAFPKFTPRDLRRSFKTLTGLMGLSKDIRDRLQAHALSDIASKHYDRYDYLTEKCEAMEAWNAWLTEIVSVKGADVVDIRAAQ